MIRELRVRHRRVFRVLVLVLPVLYVAALIVRPRSFLEGELPADAGPGPDTAETSERTRPVETVEMQRVVSGDRTFVDVVLPDDLRKPDLLVYWSAAESDPSDPERGTDGDELPEDALFLGALGGLRSARLPLADVPRGGSFLLYSLGHQTLVARANAEDSP